MEEADEGSEHLQQAAQAAQEDDFARKPILMWLVSSQFGEHLHLFSGKRHPISYKKSPLQPGREPPWSSTPPGVMMECQFLIP
jgi:hypothetical protein